MYDRSTREFEFTYRITVPPRALPAKLWVPVPPSNPEQQVISSRFELDSNASSSVYQAGENTVFHSELEPSTVGRRMTLAWRLERRPRLSHLATRRHAIAPDLNLETYLQANSRVPIDGTLGDEARSIVTPGASALENTRVLFHHVIQTYGYDCSGCTPEKGDALGDLQVACDLRRGTCTELHGVLVAYLRAVGIPSKFVFGFNVPSRVDGQIAGYHCWAEAYVPEYGWLPLDVTEARKRPEGPEREFYFGNLDANRVQFSTGRDLTLHPPQASEPVDKFIFPLCEVGTRRFSVTPEFSFRDLGQVARTCVV